MRKKADREFKQMAVKRKSLVKNGGYSIKQVFEMDLKLAEKAKTRFFFALLLVIACIAYLQPLNESVYQTKSVPAAQSPACVLGEEMVCSAPGSACAMIQKCVSNGWTAEWGECKKVDDSCTG